MYAKTLSAIAVISAAAVAAQDPPKVNTPAFVAQCKPVKLTWQGGEAPYHLYVTAPGNIKEVKADLGDQKGTSMTWKVSVPEGQKFTLNLCDKSGQCQQSGQAGPVGSGDDSCLKGGDDKGSKSGGSGGAAAGGGRPGGGGARPAPPPERPRCPCPRGPTHQRRGSARASRLSTTLRPPTPYPYARPR